MVKFRRESKNNSVWRAKNLKSHNKYVQAICGCLAVINQ